MAPKDKVTSTKPKEDLEIEELDVEKKRVGDITDKTAAQKA